MNRLLLDTNVLLWLLLGERGAVTEKAQAALEDESNEVAVSAVSIWEIAIKLSVKKLQLEAGWSRAITRLGFGAMPVLAMHAEAVETLPWHHRDPFDRMLVAQAKIEGHRLVTADSRIGRYDIEVLW